MLYLNRNDEDALMQLLFHVPSSFAIIQGMLHTTIASIVAMHASIFMSLYNQHN